MPARSQKQQKLFGIVHAVQKGDMKSPSKKISDLANSMSKKSVKDFAKTKRKELPIKLKEWIVFKENHDIVQSALTKLEAQHRILGNDWTSSVPLQKDLGLTQPEYDTLIKMKIIKKEPTGFIVDHERLTNLFPLIIGRIFPS